MQPADVAADPLIELQLALLAQLHDSGGGKALRVGSDAKTMARRERRALTQVRMAERLLEHYASAIGDSDHAAGLVVEPPLELKPAHQVLERRRERARHRRSGACPG
jgi:hypothetical protein